MDSEKIKFEREKTKRTRKADPVKVVIAINERMDAIIKKWGKEDSDYIFNLISNLDTSAQIRDKVKQFTKVTNDWMKL